MEIILAVLFVLIMVGVYYLKTRLPTRILFPLSLLIGIAMLIRFWGFCEGKTPGRILVTVLVLGGLYTTFRKQKAQKAWDCLSQWIFLAGLKFPPQELISCQDIIRLKDCFLGWALNCIQNHDTGLFFLRRFSNFNEALATAAYNESQYI